MAEDKNPRFDRSFESFRPETAALDPDQIVIDPGWNVRDMSSPETRTHIEELKASILARGIDTPVNVRYDPKTGIATLVAGQCRVTACKELKAEGHKILVPAIRAKGDEAELMARSLTENTGQPLQPWEIGVGCRRLQKYGWQPAQIAAHICKPLRFVTDAIALAEAPIEAKKLISTGKVTPARVLQEIATHGDAAVSKLNAAVDKAPPAKNGHVKPLARTKAPSPADTALDLADTLARYVVSEHQSWDDVTNQARRYLKARGLK